MNEMPNFIFGFSSLNTHCELRTRTGINFVLDENVQDDCFDYKPKSCLRCLLLDNFNKKNRYEKFITVFV